MTVAENCSSLALRHLLVTASVTTIRQVTLFDHTRCQTRCEVVLKMSEGEKCSSSPVCHLVLLELCHDLVRKGSEGVKCSSSSVCHLVLTESCCDLVLTLSDDKNCSSSPVSHFVATVAEGTLQIHMLPLEGGRRVKKSTFHLVYWLAWFSQN